MCVCMYYVCYMWIVCDCIWVSISACVEVRKQLLNKSQFFTSTMWSPGITRKWSSIFNRMAHHFATPTVLYVGTSFINVGPCQTCRWLWQKRQPVTSLCKGAEHLVSSDIVGGNCKTATIWKTIWQFLKRLNRE